MWLRRESLSPSGTCFSPTDLTQSVENKVYDTDNIFSVILQTIVSCIFRLPGLVACALPGAPGPAAAMLVDPPKAFQRRCHGCHKGLRIAEEQRTLT